LIDTYTVGSTMNPKKHPYAKINKSGLMSELLSGKKYLAIVDFDEHLNDGVERDFTNPGFDN